MADRIWWRQDTPIGEITVVLGPEGVVRISLPAGHVDPFDAVPERDVAVAAELDEYFAGTRREFTFAVDLSTVTASFQRTVLETLAREVPYGETVTYGELAAVAGRPGAARAVGTTMAHNPVPFVVPCHRVVASNGMGGYGGGYGDALAIKRALLDLERR